MTLKCFVQGCRSGWDSVRRRYKKEKKKHPQIFGAPKHWTMLQIWSHVIPVSGESFSITDKICELHFTDNYLSKFHELTLNDGKTVKLERSYVKLLPGAIPTVFPEFPLYSKRVLKVVNEMRKEFPLHIPEMDIKLDEHMQSYLNKISEVQKKFLSVSEETIRELEIDISDESISDDELDTEEGNGRDINVVNTDETFVSDDELDTEEGNADDMDVVMHNKDDNVSIKDDNPDHGDFGVEEDEGEKEADEITFDKLVENLKYVSKPNSSWSLTSHGKFVMCAKWNKAYQPEKRVVIDQDLNIKVFLNDAEIAAYKNCISEIADISNILSILDK